MDLLLMRNIETLTQLTRLLDGLMKIVAGCQSLITLLTAHVKHHMNKTEEQHRIAQRLLRAVPKAIYWSDLETPKVAGDVVTTLWRTPSETSPDEKGRPRRECRTQHDNERIQGTRSTSSGGDTQARRIHMLW